MKQKYLYCILVLALSLSVGSCARAPKKKAGPVSVTTSSTSITRENRTHTVAPGETLWRLSKMYDVPVASILKANGLMESDAIRIGQRLLIPQASEIRPVVNLYPNDRWRYIIIHHSATTEGSSTSIHRSHLAKGWDKGAGYHFIIDNGSGDKKDGQIESTPRWIKQQEGAHCKASNMNEKGIGICLVGNFDFERVSSEQMTSLIYLVNTLRKYYRIPIKNILPHGRVPESATDCPGQDFPWTQFMEGISKN